MAALDVTFSRHFPTHVVHLGKPPRSLATRAVMKGLRVWASVTGRPSARPDPWTDWTQEPFPGLGFVLRHTLIARDRHRAFLAARRKAGRGWLVVSDRLPLEGITCMDSPRCANLPGLRRRPLSGWLAAREAGYYREITSPDLLLVLRVDPETAVARRHDQDAEFVRRRAEEVWGHDWSTTMATVIDASQDQERVLTELHRRVWSAL